MPNGYGVTDADTAIFFEEQLKFIVPEMYEVIYPSMKWRDIFHVSSMRRPGTPSIERRAADRRGEAVWTSSQPSTLPRADISTKRITFPVKECATSFAYTERDLRVAKLAGESLERQQMEAAVDVINRHLETCVFNGAPELGLDGILTNSEITKTNVSATGTGDATAWDTKLSNPDDIINDVTTIATLQKVTTKGEHSAKKLGLPIEQRELLANTPRSSTSDTTLLEWMVAKLEFLRTTDDVVEIRQLAGSGDGGVDQFLLFDPDPRMMEVVIPMDVTPLKYRVEGLEYIVPLVAEFSSVHIMYPKSLWFGAGI